MPAYTIEVVVLPLPALLDPQGEAIQQALHRLGETSIYAVRAGRAFHLVIEAPSPDAALSTAQTAAQKLLHNPIIETYHLKLLTPHPSS
jgi:phosphoribosylformylglycinamidine synthase PurS subunit